MSVRVSKGFLLAGAAFAVTGLCSQASAEDWSLGERGGGADAQSCQTSDDGTEIIVTARKREEALQDVPAPVTALTADTLAATAQTQLTDFFASVPGMSLSTDNRGSSAVVLRGLNTTTFGNPTVATLIDDVPYSASTAAGMGWAATELDPSELERVEVLRGPQGVLYGAASLGGIVKYVPRRPTFDGVSGRLQVTGNTVAHGDEGYGASGAINVPLTENFALRASALARHDAGYIDNVFNQDDDVNYADVVSGRLAALWAPNDDTSLLVSFLHQERDNHGSPFVETRAYATDPITPSPFAPTLAPLGDLEQKYVTGIGGSRLTVDGLSATFQSRIGEVDLTSITGYVVNKREGSYDLNHLGFFAFVANNNYGTRYAAWFDDVETSKFSQEIRFAGTLWDNWDWQVGGFYTVEETDRIGAPAAINTQGQQVGYLFHQADNERFEDAALYGSLTWQINDAFDVQFGVRTSVNREQFSSVRTQYVATFPGSVTPERTDEGSAITYLVTPRWKITPDIMLYARYATGYRPGGANAQVSPASSLPLHYGPDTTTNYEVGLKGDFFDNRLSLDASVYHIAWQDVQINVQSDIFPYTENAGEATSDGAEIAWRVRATDDLSLSGWVAYGEGAFNEDVVIGAVAGDQTFARAGDALPYSAQWSGSISATQEFAFPGELTGEVGATYFYQGDRYAELSCLSTALACGPYYQPVRELLPAYDRIDLRFAVHGADWDLNFFVNNIQDERGALSGGRASFNNNAYSYIQPRTFGVSLARQWN